MRPREIWSMPEKSSSSVRVFYPRFKREEIIHMITENLGNLKKEIPLSLVVLFGYYGKGNYTVASDVDLLVVYKGQENREAYAIVKRAFDIPNVEPHVYTEKEYEEMKDTIEKMIKDGVTLLQNRD
jgi:uncharacterized protein